MKTYKVVITEVLKKIVEVEADSEKDALQIADNNYRAAKDGYVLGGDNYSDTKMEIYKNE